MKKHLRQMSNMISELKHAGHTLTDEEKVQVVIRSLPQNWEHIKMHLTYNENIRTLEDAMRHLELEEDRLMDNKTITDVYMTSSSSHGGKWGKCKFHGGNQQESQTNAQARKNKSSTNLEKERRKISSRKRSMCPSSSSITVVRRGIFHVIAKSPGR